MSEPQVEQRARELGWAPQAEFKGDPAKWVDADTYVERGEQVLPILRKTNEGLHHDLTELRTQNTELKAALNEAKESMSEFAKFQSEITADRVKAAKADLMGRLVTAKKDNDVESEVQLQDELTRLNVAEAAAAGEKKTPPVEKVEYQERPPEIHPVIKAWAAEHDWFGKDIRKTALAQGIAVELARNPETKHLVGDGTTPNRAFLDRVAEEVERTFSSSSSAPRVDRVAGGGGSGTYGGGGGNGKGYNDLPSDAKEVVNRQATRFVGPNKMFKDLKAWQDHYAAQFFAGE